MVRPSGRTTRARRFLPLKVEAGSDVASVAERSTAVRCVRRPSVWKSWLFMVPVTVSSLTRVQSLSMWARIFCASSPGAVLSMLRRMGVHPSGHTLASGHRLS